MRSGLTFRAVLSASSEVTEVKTHHSVTLPDYDVICRFDSIDMSRQILVHLPCPVSSNHSDFPRYPIRVDHFRQLASVCHPPSSTLTSSAGSIVGPTLIPLIISFYSKHSLITYMGFAIPLKYSTCAPSSCLVRSPIQTK